MLNPGLAWSIRARICRRDIADEPVARIATLARISWQFSIVRWLWITDGGRLERDGKAQLGYLRLNWSRVEESNFLLGEPSPPFLPLDERTGFLKSGRYWS